MILAIIYAIDLNRSPISSPLFNTHHLDIPLIPSLSPISPTTSPLFLSFGISHHVRPLAVSRASCALGYVFNLVHRYLGDSRQQLTRTTAKPMMASTLVRAAPSAAISTSTPKSATSVEPAGQQGSDPSRLPVSGMPRREVPLPSQEGKQGVAQYALYVHPLSIDTYSLCIPFPI